MLKVTYLKCSKCNLTAQFGPLAEITTTCHSCGAPRVEISKAGYDALDVERTWVRQQSQAFLQSEGYFETARGVIECHTSAQWLDLARQSRYPQPTREPYQKGDSNYGLS
jgi:hypothetical protein